MSDAISTLEMYRPPLQEPECDGPKCSTCNVQMAIRYAAWQRKNSLCIMCVTQQIHTRLQRLQLVRLDGSSGHGRDVSELVIEMEALCEENQLLLAYARQIDGLNGAFRITLKHLQTRNVRLCTLKLIFSISTPLYRD